MATIGVAAGGLIGLAVWVASSDLPSEQDVAVAPAPASPEPATVAPPKAKPASAAQLTLRVASRLQSRGQHTAALAVIAEFEAKHGTLPSKIRHLQSELEAEVAKATPARKAKKRAAPKPAAAPVAHDGESNDEQDEEDDYDYDYDADDDDSVDWPDEAESAPQRAVNPPQPVSTRSEPTAADIADLDDEEECDEDLDDDEFDDLGIDTTSPVAMAMNELLTVPHSLRKNMELSVNYPMEQGGELEDFESLGFDKFEICRASRSAGAWAEPILGLEVGVSSQRVARMWHAVTLTDAFEIELEMWVNAGGSRSSLVFLVGKKVGVSWGQEIVKVSKRGATRRISGKVDRNVFRGERKVKIKITARDNTLTIKCDGRTTAKKAFKSGELKGRFGMIAKGVRFQVLDLRINGFVDPSKL